MSVRDAAGRHPRLTRGAPSTDEIAAGRRRRRPGAHRQAHRTRGSAGRAPLPLAFCLVVLGVALLEAITIGAGGPGGSTAASGGPASGVLAAVGPSRIAAGPDLVTDSHPAGNAPRRVTPAQSIGASARAAAAAATAFSDPPPCAYGDRRTPLVGYGDWATTLVDTTFALPASYRPPNLVPVGRAGIAGWGLVRSLVIDDLRALSDAAKAAGNPLAVQSAFRSRGRQAEVFADWVASSGEDAARRFSARPGHSEHQLGTALDLRAVTGGAPWSGSFGSTQAGRWLGKHAHEFGFLLTYPAGAEAQTCYGAESWHVRYVGRAMAAEVEASGLPLRVWLWRYARSG